MKSLNDGYDNYVVTQSQSLVRVFFRVLIFVGIVFIVDYVQGGYAPGSYYIICFLAIGIYIFSGFKRVPFKHYGLRTFGKPVADEFVYEEGIHWIPPWFGMRLVSLEPFTISYKLDNIQTINNILFSIKGTVIYKMGNAYKFSNHKTEADKRIRVGVENAISNIITEKQLTDRELSGKTPEIKAYILKELEHLKDECGICILSQSIEWNKPLNEKIIDNFADEAKFSSQIKRIATLANELNISAEEAFRIEGIRTGLIQSTESVFRIAGAKQIIEAAKAFMTK